MTDLTVAGIGRHLETSRLGRTVVVLAEVTSTMDALAALAAEGAAEGTVVVADHQSAGRGRFDRTWEAPPGTALLLSVLFRPTGPAERLGQVPMALALGALEAVAAALPAGVPVGLKWPNDLQASGLKLAGLLAEASWAPSGAVEVRVGLGLNVRQAPDALPAGAVSLALLADRVPDRSWLAATILNATDRHYTRLLAGDSLLPAWSARLTTLGQAVTAVTAQGEIQGVAEAVSEDGALIVRTADDLVTLRAADVTLRRIDAGG